MGYKVQTIIDQLNNDQLSIEEIRELLHHETMSVRANAVSALAKHIPQNEALIDDLSQVVRDPENYTPVFMGFITVAYWAIINLLQTVNPKAVLTAKQLIEEMPDPHRSELLAYLRANSLITD
jgi:DNA-binding transcriptional MerR regulator